VDALTDLGTDPLPDEAFDLAALPAYLHDRVTRLDEVTPLLLGRFRRRVVALRDLALALRAATPAS
jgi:hypothetical protein